MPVYRGKLPTPNRRGDVRSYVKEHKFTVGNIKDTTETQMRHRLNTLRDVFERQAQYYEIDYWAAWVVPYAKQYARTGEVRFSATEMARKVEGHAAEDVTIFETLRSFGLTVKTDDHQVLDTGLKSIQRMVDERIQRAIESIVGTHEQRFGEIPTLAERLSVEPNGSEHRSFHQGLTAYQKHIKATGKKKDNGGLADSPSNYIKWIEKLKSVHEDFPLIRFDKARLEEITAYWRNREYRYTVKGKEKPIGKDYADHIMQALWSALHWIADEPSWKWSLPAGASKIDRKIIPLNCDRKRRQTRRIQGTIYTPDQLAKIAGKLDTFGKMLLGISVNCAMQPAESGRLEVDDFYTLHPETGKEGNFVIFDRPKTYEYGEWLLWDEVAELVQWGVARSERLGCERLLVTDKGKPWYNDDSRQSATKMSKWWQAIPTEKNKHIGLVTRMNRDDPSFPRYPIKSLRKILPSWIRPRREFGKELADLANARKIDDDGLRKGNVGDRYSDRPYDVLADVIRELESDFRPFLDALKIQEA